MRQSAGPEAEDLLPLKPQLLSAGNPTLLIAVKDKAAVDRASLDLTALRVLKGAANELFCVFLFATTPDGAYSPMFAPDHGVPEDPATGSSTGPLAVFMIRQGLLSSSAGTRFVSEQGTRMDRRSLLHVELRGKNGTDGIYVGGHVTPIIEAVMNLPSRC